VFYSYAVKRFGVRASPLISDALYLFEGLPRFDHDCELGLSLQFLDLRSQTANFLAYIVSLTVWSKHEIERVDADEGNTQANSSTDCPIRGRRCGG